MSEMYHKRTRITPLIKHAHRARTESLSFTSASGEEDTRPRDRRTHRAPSSPLARRPTGAGRPTLLPTVSQHCMSSVDLPRLGGAAASCRRQVPHAPSNEAAKSPSCGHVERGSTAELVPNSLSLKTLSTHSCGGGLGLRGLRVPSRTLGTKSRARRAVPRSVAEAVARGGGRGQGATQVPCADARQLKQRGGSGRRSQTALALARRPFRDTRVNNHKKTHNI